MTQSDSDIVLLRAIKRRSFSSFFFYFIFLLLILVEWDLETRELNYAGTQKSEQNTWHAVVRSYIVFHVHGCWHVRPLG